MTTVKITADNRISEQDRRNSVSNNALSSTTSRPEKANTDTDSVQSSGSIRRTEAERILYFKNQPECGELEPHRVRCTRCDSYVNLGRKQSYNVRSWEVHRVKCDARAGDSPHTPLKQKHQEIVDTESTAASSLTDSSHRLTEADRIALLEADTRADVIQPYQVKCRTCHKWIQLSKKRRYELYHWKRHKETCSRPSHRVTAAERKLRLVNDTQAKSFDIMYVQCSLCDRKIVLEGDDDYNLVNWHEHKAICFKELKPTTVVSADSADTLVDLSNTPNSVPFPSEEAPVPTEDDTPTSQFLSHKNLKRARSLSNALITNEDGRPANRPRRESYAVVVDLPSVLDCIFLPVKAFVRGFRESLTQTNTII